MLCCFDDKDMSINRYNQIATQKKSLISLRQKNEYANFGMKACDVIINSHIQGPNLACLVIIKWPFSGPQLSICGYQFT